MRDGRRKRKCRRKRRYADKPAAIRAAIAIGQKKARHLRAYKCPLCSHWHLARDRRRSLRAAFRRLEKPAAQD